MRKQRSVLGAALWSLWGSYVYVAYWLDVTAEDLNAEQGTNLPSAWGRGFGFRWLREWARGVSRATHGQLSPRGVLLRLALYPVGVPLLQHHLNATRVVLPEARLLPERPSTDP